MELLSEIVSASHILGLQFGDELLRRCSCDFHDLSQLIQV